MQDGSLFDVIGSQFETAPCTGSEMIVVEQKSSFSVALLERLGLARDTGKRVSQARSLFWKRRRGHGERGRLEAPCLVSSLSSLSACQPVCLQLVPHLHRPSLPLCLPLAPACCRTFTWIAQWWRSSSEHPGCSQAHPADSASCGCVGQADQGMNIQLISIPPTPLPPLRRSPSIHYCFPLVLSIGASVCPPSI